MKTYTIRVYETRSVQCDYEVEAHSHQEAIEKAMEGDTVQETDADSEVMDRFVPPQREPRYANER